MTSVVSRGYDYVGEFVLLDTRGCAVFFACDNADHLYRVAQACTRVLSFSIAACRLMGRSWC